MNIEDLWESWVNIPDEKIQKTVRFLVWDYRNFVGDVPHLVEWRHVSCSWNKEFRVRPA